MRPCGMPWPWHGPAWHGPGMTLAWVGMAACRHSLFLQPPRSSAVRIFCKLRRPEATPSIMLSVSRLVLEDPPRTVRSRRLSQSELAIAHSAVPTSPLCTPCNGNISAESHTLQLKTTSLLLWLCSTRLSPLASAFSDFTRDTPHAGFPAAVAKVSADAGRSFTATTATGRSFTATRVERSNELASSTHALIACLFHLMRSCRQSL